MNWALLLLLSAIIGLALLSGLLLAAYCALCRCRRQSEKSLQAEREKADAIWDGSPFGVVILDERFEVVRANPVAQQMLAGGEASHALSGQSAWFPCPDDNREQETTEGGGGEDWRIPLRKALDPVINGGKSLCGVEIPVVLFRDHKACTVWLRVNAKRFQLHGRHHVLVVFDDITEALQNRKSLERAAVEMQRLNEAVRYANDVKGQFFANMSHEIRTPLNGIIGTTELLIDTEMSEEQRRLIDMIRVSGSALLVVVNDIFDYAQIESNELVLEDESFDLSQCVEAAIRLVMPGALKKHLEIVCQIDPKLHSVWIGDMGRIRQILVKLLTNAIKFTERGEIAVAVSGEKQAEHSYRLDFSVRDTGVGIPPEQQGKLLQGTYAANGLAASVSGSTAIGLTLVKRLCEIMGGSLAVESKGVPGHGSVFRFSVMVKTDAHTERPLHDVAGESFAGRKALVVDDNATSRELITRQLESWEMVPVAVASGSGALDWLKGPESFDVAVLDYEMPGINGLKLAETIRKLPNRQGLYLILLSPLGERAAGGDRTCIDACLFKPALASRLSHALSLAFSAGRRLPAEAEPKSRDASFAAEHPLRILVADDNLLNQKVAVSLLAKLGYHADVVGDGVEAVEAVKRTPYDLVLMDIQMPSLDGEQAAIRIRKEVPAQRQPKIVAVTANVLMGDPERYLSSGMDEFIPKPIRLEQLAEVIRLAHPRSGDAALSASKIAS